MEMAKATHRKKIAVVLGSKLVEEVQPEPAKFVLIGVVYYQGPDLTNLIEYINVEWSLAKEVSNYGNTLGKLSENSTAKDRTLATPIPL
jgi:hypothetical protein|tara:strand:- start:299 stop:565 length:267 start_codon:yes stop_codon:yes gene_type:complete